MKLANLHLPHVSSFERSEHNRLHNFSLRLFRRWHLFTLWLHERSRTQYLAACFALFVAPTFVFTTLFMLPKNHTFSYASDNCFFNPTFLPNHVDSRGSGMFQESFTPSVSAGSMPLFSAQTCVSLTMLPDQSAMSETLTLSALPLVSKNISLQVEAPPTLSFSYDAQSPLPLTGQLTFALDTTDLLFGYELAMRDKTAMCTVDGLSVSCPLSSFTLAQGEQHDYQINRVLGEEKQPIIESSLTLIAPVSVTSATITEGELIYDARQDITLTANKPIQDVAGVQLSVGEQTLDSTFTIDNNQLLISLSDPLPRSAEISLTVDSITAVDGATSTQPYNLSFTTSGGPRVAGSSIGSYGVAAAETIVISFDVGLDPSQNIASFVSLSNASGPIDAAVSLSGNRVTINPTAALPFCQAFTVSIAAGLTSQFGVGNGEPWSLNSRTGCAQVFSIGSSVQGRAITAYKFGSGSDYVVFVAGMHGDERSSNSTLFSWIDELDRNVQRIPAGRSVVVIPNHNPDAYVVGSRLNANNVDLNRNFPTNDWASLSYLPGNIPLENGGGTSPLSEPESSALASYILSVSPRVVLTYHATAGAVIANGSGDSSALANLYAAESGFYTVGSGAGEDELFGYPTTGAFEDWLHDGPGIPALLVELRTLSSNEISTQRPAMWAMVEN